MTELDYGQFDAITFDCYGTLIDWETGIATGLRRVLDASDIRPDTDELLERYAAVEAELEAGPYRRYRDVLAGSLERVAASYGVTADADGLARFGGSVADWPAFPGLGGGPRQARDPVPPRGPDELRRRPVRGVEPPARRRPSTGS